MKNILVLNGSPRGERSNTLRLTKAFCEGLNADQGYRIETVTANRLNVKHCLGCFNCWTKTPGRCVQKDDMADLLEKYVRADLIIWSFPLYYFGMPSGIKAVMDRLLPLNLPFIEQRSDGTATHPARYDRSRQQTILISTCGFFSREGNYEGLEAQFGILQGEEGNGRSPVRILCPEGELFSVSQLNGRTGVYLDIVRKAGEEYSRLGEISDETAASLEEVLYPPEAFMEMANANWDIRDESSDAPKNDNRAERFMRQMAAAYRPEAYAKDLVIEFYFTDVDKGFQLHVREDGCRLTDAGEADCDTRIETPFSVWLDISEGRKDGAQAMMDGLYRVSGEFDTMNRMDALFGAGDAPAESPTGKEPRRANMNLLLFPWIALWIFLPMTPLARWGGVAAIGLSAAAAALGAVFRLTPYDRITIPAVTVLGLLAILGANASLLVCVSYLGFGLMWLLSNLTAIPLTAYYSSGKYGGDRAYGNPLFIKTNRILTACWGGFYVLVSVVSWFLLQGPLGPYTGIINQIGPVVLGIFTWWFQRWYPAKVAGGSRA